MSFTLIKLPSSNDSLEPVISSETISYHYGKHHQTYVDKLNAFIEGTPLEQKSLEEIIKETAGKQPKVFNNAAQVWNHDFYWHCMAPDGGGDPDGELAEALRKSFGGVKEFREQFSQASAELFGSGWAWLVKEGDRLVIDTTKDGDNPLAHGRKALLTLDLWEHAYYIDYRNARPKRLRFAIFTQFRRVVRHARRQLVRLANLVWEALVVPGRRRLAASVWPAP